MGKGTSHQVWYLSRPGLYAYQLAPRNLISNSDIIHITAITSVYLQIPHTSPSIPDLIIKMFFFTWFNPPPPPMLPIKDPPRELLDIDIRAPEQAHICPGSISTIV